MLPILIVDDSPGDIALAERTLRSCKILNPVITLTSGEELLEYFAGEFTRPVLVLLDMVMQPISGTDVLRALKERGVTESIAFVMLSGLSQYRNLHEGYQLGARTFLVKPLRPEDVLQLLNNVPGLAVQELKDGYVLEAKNEPMKEADLRTVEFG